jgi:isoquinoline 1-oxidoreductase beta subunit
MAAEEVGAAEEIGSLEEVGFQISRRQFLGGAVSTLVIGFVLPGFKCAPAATTTRVNTWLEIGSDESIVLTIGSSEMGQGSFSGLAQILAEDLMVSYERIRAVQGGPTLANPAPIGSAINTVGSGVTRGNYWKLRDAGAAARELLVQAAMLRHGDATRANYTVSDGVITHVPSGATASYGQLAAAAAALPVPTSAALVPDSQLTQIGRSVPRVDIPLKVDGRARYGLDIRLPNMVYAVIKHCPTFGGTLASTPATPSGMIAVVPTQVVPSVARGAEAAGHVNAVAVVGPNTWDTWQAAKRLSVSWTVPAEADGWNDADFLATGQALALSATPYVKGAANPPGTLYTVEGDAAAADAAIANG